MYEGRHGLAASAAPAAADVRAALEVFQLRDPAADSTDNGFASSPWLC